MSHPQVTRSRGHRLFISALLSLLSLLLGLSSVVYAQGPVAQGVYPAPNSHSAPPSATVAITYNQAISPTTVTSQTLVIQARQTGVISQSYSVNGGLISFTPNQPFKPGELVQVSAATATRTLSGTTPLSPTVWQFQATAPGGSGFLADSAQALGSNIFGRRERGGYRYRFEPGHKLRLNCADQKRPSYLIRGSFLCSDYGYSNINAARTHLLQKHKKT